MPSPLTHGLRSLSWILACEFEGVLKRNGSSDQWATFVSGQPTAVCLHVVDRVTCLQLKQLGRMFLFMGCPIRFLMGLQAALKHFKVLHATLWTLPVCCNKSEKKGQNEQPEDDFASCWEAEIQFTRNHQPLGLYVEGDRLACQGLDLGKNSMSDIQKVGDAETIALPCRPLTWSTALHASAELWTNICMDAVDVQQVSWSNFVQCLGQTKLWRKSNWQSDGEILRGSIYQRKFRSSNFRLYWKLPVGLAASMFDSRDVLAGRNCAKCCVFP